MSRLVAPTVKSRRGEPVVIFRVGEQRFLLSSGEIEDVRDVQSGAVPATVTSRGKTARQVPVVSAAAGFGLRSAASQQLLVLRNYAVAVAIDGIECMSELREVVALPSGFRGEERTWYRGLAMVDGRILPVVNPAMFAGLSNAIADRTGAAAGSGLRQTVGVRTQEAKAGA